MVYHYLFCFQLKSPALAVFSNNQVFIDYLKKMVMNDESVFSNTVNYPFSSVVAILQVAKICPLCRAATAPTILLSYNRTLLWMFLNT